MTADKYYPQAVLMWLEADRPRLMARRSVELWAAIADELLPMVGDRGFVALFNRCLDVCGRTFPWLKQASGRGTPSQCFDMLASQLSEREPADGLTASRALFGTFYDLLSMLIGEALAAGVLDAAWRDRLRHSADESALVSLPSQPEPKVHDEHKQR